jgi:hypothetical protein
MTALRAYSPPTIHEEIERKAWQTLEWLSESFHKGRLTEQQFSTGYDALFMAVSGLVDDGGFLEAVSEAGNLANSSKYVTKRHFHHVEKDEIVTFCWHPGEDNVTLIRRINGVAVNGKNAIHKDAKDAAAFMQSIGDRMTASVWIEL